MRLKNDFKFISGKNKVLQTKLRVYKFSVNFSLYFMRLKRTSKPNYKLFHFFKRRWSEQVVKLVLRGSSEFVIDVTVSTDNSWELCYKTNRNKLLIPSKVSFECEKILFRCSYFFRACKQQEFCGMYVNNLSIQKQRMKNNLLLHIFNYQQK